jgi:general secretion pathway protein A
MNNGHFSELLRYWNLRERPFEAAGDTRFFFQSHDHEEALGRLTFLAGEESMLFGMLTGEAGCGKSLTRAVFAERLDAQRFKTVTQEHSGLSFNDLMVGALKGLTGGVRAARTRSPLGGQLLEAAEKLHASGRRLVLIFDEAQEMSPATLNELKTLTNGGTNHLTVLLVGEPELRDQVERQPAIHPRIHLRFHLNSLDLPDAANYLRHRLTVAGHPTGQLFTAEAAERAYQASRGVPRELNRIARLALEHAWAKGHPNVPPTSVNIATRDLERQMTDRQLILA